MKRPLLCGVLIFVIGEILGSVGCLAWGPGIAAAGLAVLLLWQRYRKPAVLFPGIFMLSFLIFGVLNGTRCHQQSILQAYADTWYAESEGDALECDMIGVVMRAEKQDETMILCVRASEIRHQNLCYQRPCQLKLYTTDSTVQIGNQIQCSVTLQHLSEPTNPGEFDSQQYYRARGIEFLAYADEITVVHTGTYPLRQWLWQLRLRAQQVFETVMTQEKASVMNAMLLGDSGNLDTEIRKLYQKNGISHILAISGLHVSILGSFLYSLLRKTGAPYPAAGIPVFLLLLSYGWLTGASGSTVRAITMLMLSVLGDVLGRTYDMLTAIGIAAMMQLIAYPDRLFDAGFLLSFGAVLALGLILPAWKALWDGKSKEMQKRRTVQTDGKLRSFWRKRGKFLKESLVAGVMIQVVTGPIIIYFYYEYPIYGIFLNLYVIPVMTPLLLCGILSLLLAPWSMTLAGLAALPCDWILTSLTTLCRLVQKLPGAIWQAGGCSVWALVGYYGILFACYLCLRLGRKRAAVVGMCLLLAGICCRGREGLTITMLDVGQGDCFLVETPEHQFLLIDGGSSSRSSVGDYVITPAVKYYGSGKLDYVFVSHMDTDHVSGIQELIEASANGGIEIGCLVLPKAGEQQEASGFPELAAAAAEAEIPVLYIQSGSRMQSGSVQISCLYPAAEYTYSDANNNSMVLSLQTDGFRMLFTGDLESEGETQISPGTYDVLKVGHHGSSGASSMEFLEQVQPQIALISCGAYNLYGHPHAETLDRLAAVGSSIYQTPESGAVTLSVRRGTLRITQWK